VEAVRHFADALGSVSANPVVYAELPGAQHAFDLFHSLRYEMVVDAVEAFTAWVRSRQPRDLRVQVERRRESNPHHELGMLPRQAPDRLILRLGGHGHEPWLSVND
jgi:acetyl esterase/lipase